MRVLAAGVVEKAVVGHIGEAQVRALQSHRHTQQHTEERGRRAGDRHHCWRRVSGSILLVFICGCVCQPTEKRTHTHLISEEI